MGLSLSEAVRTARYLVDDSLPSADWLMTSLSDGARGVWPSLVPADGRILAAYDNAIAPISGRHEKFYFFSVQSEWLQGIVDGRSDAAPEGA